ncbi:hypothetical protein ASPACDRAFT_64532 [Aspergillus aculeatus ATCC 16872]|uniref:TIL domain-containing protein n=1 Tax=Aspergillus aculeatus (strain ATCC 16872 / CBS 172.66 / WB 5094) TaxID=690307 RepID=A0A1L9WGM8_ASPA1|nr:uncharacterized protein ASPACDRAFT_64532 [Aspergillus aculeatus ATCC 16872]OJJ95257.1 hypothetical protein ASPACDRAFT_64532 [Aspergillus aculeatus ATCC 16872]
MMHLSYISLILSAALTAANAESAGKCPTPVVVLDPNSQPHCCPSGYQHNGVDCVACVPPDLYYNPRAQKCEKPSCPDGQVFFWSLNACDHTDRCKPWGYYNGRDCAPNPYCPDDRYWDPLKLDCVPTQCQHGQVYLAHLDKCEEKAFCDPDVNQVYLPFENRCETCRPDEYPSPTGCQPRPGCLYPEYYYQGPDKGCAPCADQNTFWNGKECEKLPDCLPTQHRVGRVCVNNDCKVGTYWDKKKLQCLPVKPCEIGYIFDGVDDCIPIEYPPEGGPICYVKCDRAGPLGKK